jgi:trimethylamine--corrinoid protein Co-methyltransferase
MTDQEVQPGRRRRRPQGAEASHAVFDRTQSYRHLANPFTPMEVFSADEVARIHEGALTILETTGMRVLLAEARTVFAAGGAEVDEATQMVRLDRELVAKALATVPRAITLHAKDPARSLRAGTFEDFCNILKLTQSFEVLQVLGGCVEPQDVPVQLRHLETTRAMLLLSDKIPLVYARGTAQIEDNFELIRIAYGLTPEEFRARPYTATVINTNSPLQLDIPMAGGILDFAAAGQVLIITPFTLAGAMAPVTVAGALTLAHAEALFGLTLAQMVRPGAPVIYGSFTSNVDMKSGSPAFGTPEYVKSSFGAGQLARHIGVPWRSSNATASNAPDAQAAYESQMSLWGALMGGCNFVLHAAGWLESGLSTSYEKFILDVEMLQMFAETFQPLGATAADLALEAVAEVGPSGHFFGCAHTMERYRSAFYAPLVSDWRNFGQWTEAGAHTATERATQVCAETLARYAPPARDPAVIEALDAYVARRTEAGGAPPVS